MKWKRQWQLKSQWKWSVVISIALLCGIVPNVYAAPKDGFVIKPKYDEAMAFDGGVAFVLEVNESEKWSLSGYKWGLIDKKGKYIAKPQYDQVADSFQEELAFVKKEGKWGYIDRSGKMVIEPAFDLANNFSEGRAAVKVGHKWGYIDKTGKIIIEPKYYEAGLFVKGSAIVNIAGYKSAIIDPSGEIIKKLDYIIKDKYKEGYVHQFRDEVVGSNNAEEVLWIKDHDNYWGLIDKKGNEIRPPMYGIPCSYAFTIDSLHCGFSENIALVETAESNIFNGTYKTVFINTKGEIIEELEAYEDKATSMFKEGLLAFCSGEENDVRCGFTDKKGKQVIKPKYDLVSDFSDGLAAVLTKDKWGVINKKGDTVIKPMYDQIMPFIEGRTWVSINEKWGLIDRSGKAITGLIYDYPNGITVDSHAYFQDGLAIVVRDEQYGMIDQEGKEVIKSIYANVELPSEGLIAATLDGELWGYIGVPGAKK